MRRSSRLQEALLDGKSGFPSHFKKVNLGALHLEQCGACLLDVDTVGEDGELLAILDVCQPHHCFHTRCIYTWAERENSCPQCKQRFSKIGIYSENGDLLRVTNVQEKDQEEDEGNEDADEEQICLICNRSDNEAALLLCDGDGGQCDGACHYFCIGLPGVPEGDWFCPQCEESRPQRTAKRRASIPHSSPRLDAIQDTPPTPSSSSTAGPPALLKVKQEPPTEEYPTKALQLSQPEAKESQKALIEGHSQDHDRKKAVSKAKVKSESSTSAQVSSSSLADVPKWISRQGNTIRVDLGGRNMRCSAATVLAKVVRTSLQQVSSGNDLVVSLHLAGNRLKKAGLSAILKAIETLNFHIASIDVERNELDPEALVWLTKWALRQPGGPPASILLSHNPDIGDPAALHGFISLGSVALRTSPLWLEVASIGIRGVDRLLDVLSDKVPICLAADRSSCGPTQCIACESENPPRLHLHGILEQCDDVEEEELKEVSSPLPPSAVAPKEERPEDSQQSGLWQEEILKQRRRRPRQKSEVEEPADIPPEVAQREERKVWASSLGKKVNPDIGSADPLHSPVPTRGMWDLVRANERAARKRQKQLRLQTSHSLEPSSTEKACENISPVSRYIPKRKKSSDKVEVAQTQQADPWLPLAWKPETVVLPFRGDTIIDTPKKEVESQEEGFKVVYRQIASRLNREQSLWSNINTDEGRLRRRCLAEQFANQAMECFAYVVACSKHGTWAAFLRTSLGHQRIHQWLDRKIAEQLEILSFFRRV